MATLKISDLSVGDWVQYRDREWQVCSLYQFTGEVGLWRKDSQICENVADCKPIPITAEILEKNGFSNNGEKWYTPELFTLERWSDNWDIVIACSCGDYVCEVCTIKYVHQLQHALRLAGLDKEINL